MTATAGYETTIATTNRPASYVRGTWDEPHVRVWSQGISVPADALVWGARQKINRLLALGEGWDGHRAHPPTVQAAIVANGLLQHLIFDDAPTPQIAPSVDGGIDLDWLVNGLMVSLNVASDGHVGVSVEYDDQDPEIDGEFELSRVDWDLLDAVRPYLEKMRHGVHYRAAIG